MGVIDKLVAEPAHRVAAPTCYCIVVYAFRLVGNDQILVYAYDLAVALAERTCTQWVVETEQMLGRTLERDAVRLETGRKLASAVIGDYDATVSAVSERARNRFVDTCLRIVVGRGAQTGDNDVDVVGAYRIVDCGDEILYQNGFPVMIYALDSVRKQ